MRPTLPRTAHGVLTWVAVLLTLAAIVTFLFFGLGLLALLWTGLASAFAGMRLSLQSARAGLNICLAVLLMPVLILLAGVGGLFFVPAAVALAFAQLVDSPSGQRGPRPVAPTQ